jgi:hypothetical protein
MKWDLMTLLKKQKTQNYFRKLTNKKIFLMLCQLQTHMILKILRIKMRLHKKNTLSKEQLSSLSNRAQNSTVQENHHSMIVQHCSSDPARRKKISFIESYLLLKNSLWILKKQNI